MSQAVIDVRPPDLATARAVGQVAQQLATDRAERDVPEFRSRAEAAILARLAAGPASGEDCTDYVRSRGIPLASNGKELGSLYRAMRKRGLIKVVGSCDRAHGNGTGGGKVYALGDCLGN